MELQEEFDRYFTDVFVFESTASDIENALSVLSPPTRAYVSSYCHGRRIFHNLQGIEVAAEDLTPGIYVRRQGNKASKVSIR